LQSFALPFSSPGLPPKPHLLFWLPCSVEYYQGLQKKKDGPIPFSPKGIFRPKTSGFFSQTAGDFEKSSLESLTGSLRQTLQAIAAKKEFKKSCRRNYFQLHKKYPLHDILSFRDFSFLYISRFL